MQNIPAPVGSSHYFLTEIKGETRVQLRLQYIEIRKRRERKRKGKKVPLDFVDAGTFVPTAAGTV